MSSSDRIYLHGSTSAERTPLEAFIQQIYASAYGARISTFLPLLLELRNDSGSRAVLDKALRAKLPIIRRPAHIQPPLEELS